MLAALPGVEGAGSVQEPDVVASVDRHAGRLARPNRIVDLTGARRIAPVVAWLKSNGVAVLNIAGPRESKNPGIYDLARDFLRELLAF